jgi:hypothetical protein
MGAKISRHAAWPLVGCLWFAACNLSGCTVLLLDDAHQCEADADCKALGPDFEGTFCSQDHICQDSLEYCKTNVECIDRNQTESYICRQSDHHCVNLLTPECPKLLADKDDLRSENVIVLGHLGFPSTALPLLAGENGLEMARQEFRDVTGGAPSGTPRPVVVVSCDVSPFLPDDHKAASDHLIDEVGVPLIFGPIIPDWMSYAMPKAIEKGIAIITAGSNVSYEGLNERVGIMFRNNYWQAAVPSTEAALIKEHVEPAIRTKLGLPATEDIRIAVVYTDEGVWISTVQDTFNTVKINGKSAIDNGSNYKQFTYGSADDPDFESKLANVVLAVANYKPHIVVYIGGAETADAMLQIENQYSDTVYHITPGAAAEQRVIDFIGTNEARRTRIFAIQGGQISKDPNYAKFLVQYEAKFPEGGKGIIAGGIGAPQYDEYYLAMYAIAANGANPLTGKNLGQMFLNRLNGGTVIEMGATSIESAFQKLQVGESISYHGAYSYSRFDQNGDITPRVIVICVSKDATLENRFVESGLYYDPETKMLEGMNTCL